MYEHISGGAKKETYRSGERMYFESQWKTSVNWKQLTPGIDPSMGMGA